LLKEIWMERVEDIEPIKENIIPSSKGYRIGDLKQSAAIGGSFQESWERERRLRFEQLKVSSSIFLIQDS
jgi:hypothetical protein